jgi:hypothetical protein
MPANDPMGMTQERSRRLGQALMAFAGVQLLFFFAGATRRSYLVVAIPVGIAVGIASGLAFWVGYTMATQDWDDPADYPPAANEGAPPPDTLG